LREFALLAGSPNIFSDSVCIVIKVVLLSKFLNGG
jgi:hypothetical protein